MKVKEPGRGICQACGEEKPAHLASCAYSPNHPLRVQGIQQRAAYNCAAEEGKVPRPFNFRNVVELSSEELDAMGANADAWLSDPGALKKELMRDILIGYQIDRALGFHPDKIKSRSGAQIGATCRGRVLDLAQKLYTTFDGEGDEGGKGK